MNIFKKIWKALGFLSHTNLPYENEQVQFLPTDPKFSQNISRIRMLADRHKWLEIAFMTNNRTISFRKGKDRINVYYSTMTVGTCLAHPKQGKTQLFRKKVQFDELDKIFENPRTHTGKGYHRKHRKL